MGQPGEEEMLDQVIRVAGGWEEYDDNSKLHMESGKEIREEVRSSSY